MPVKIDPLIREELASMSLVLWEAKHAKNMVWNEAKGKFTSREDKSWVIVTITGPGVIREVGRGAPTLRQAVDEILRDNFSDRVPGVRGALLRLERALSSLKTHAALQRMMLESEYDGDPDDFIPF